MCMFSFEKLISIITTMKNIIFKNVKIVIEIMSVFFVIIIILCIVDSDRFGDKYLFVRITTRQLYYYYNLLYTIYKHCTHIEGPVLRVGEEGAVDIPHPRCLVILITVVFDF